MRLLKPIMVFLLLWVYLLNAQVDTSLIQRQDVLLYRFEELLDDDEGNHEELEELLQEEQEQGEYTGLLNLNGLSPERALQYLLLSDFQYYQLLSYQSEYGDMVSVYELNAVEGFTMEDVRRLLPLVTVEPAGRKKNFFRNFFKKSKNSLLFRFSQVLERQSGYDKTQDKHYLGSPQRLAFKYQFSTQDKLFLAVSGEKDAGEQFFKGAQKYGFDFYSAYLCVKNIGVLKMALVGDYKLDFGQGLVLGSSMLGGKGGGVGAVRHFAGMIKPVAPMNEGKALRGVAATVGNYSYTGTVFAGYRKYDGYVFYDEDSTRLFEGTLNSSGYHRTVAEQEKSNTLKSWVMGGDFLYRHRVFRIGARVLYTLFNAEVLPTGRVYQQFAFTGKGIFNAGVDYQMILKKVLLFGEAGLSGNGGWAFVQGATFELSPGASFAVMAHYYGKRYVALQSASYSSSQGEWGFYLTGQLVLGPKVDLCVFYDFTAYPWLRYRVDAPSRSMQIGAMMNYAISRKVKLLLRYQYKMKHKNKAEATHVNGLEAFHTSKLRLSCEYQPMEILELKTEADYLVNHSKALDYQRDGLLLYQDVGVNLKKCGLGFNLRIAFFDTDTYEERLYAYENDLYYSFTVNSHYDKGWRACLLLSYAYKCFHLWVRLSQTYFLNKEEISSGLDLIAQKHKTELKFQLMLKW